MPNGKNVNWCKWITCMGLVTAIVLAVLALNKVNKECCNKQKYKGFGFIPNPAGSALWGKNSAEIIKDCKSKMGKVCTGNNCGGNAYSCSGENDCDMYGPYDLNFTPEYGSAIAYDTAGCSNPSGAGEGYLCGGPFDECNPTYCNSQGGLPGEATGICHM